MRRSLFIVIIVILLIAILLYAEAQEKKTKKSTKSITKKSKSKTQSFRTAGLSIGAIVGIVIASVCGPFLCLGCLIGLVCYCGWCSFDLFRRKQVVAETPFYGETTTVNSGQSKIYY
jgi:predicted histidine transporter YuiF (NhaC family)